MTSMSRSHRGQDVSQTHSPAVTGKTSTQTTPCTTQGKPRKDCQTVSRSAWLNTSAAAKPSHRTVRMADAPRFMIMFIISNLLALSLKEEKKRVPCQRGSLHYPNG